MINQTDISYFNTLGHFCGQRDLPTLTSTSLNQNYGLNQVDVFVLFGGSIIYGVNTLAQAIQQQIAKKYLIVGGFGHTTATLQQTVTLQYPDIVASKMSEAEIFATLLKKQFNLSVDYLETQSTNCGNNITYLLDLLNQKQVPLHSIILSQDATMQKRMSACLAKYVDSSVQIINFAAYQNQLILNNQQLEFQKKLSGMWTPESYMKLLMGEIARLTDNLTGYGPLGKNFINHVEIPADVKFAYDFLKAKYPQINRLGNNLYSSKKN